MIYPDRDEQDKDLPMPWYRYFTDEGEEYFFNNDSGETTWEHPCPDAGGKEDSNAAAAAASATGSRIEPADEATFSQQPGAGELQQNSSSGAISASTHVHELSEHTRSPLGREVGEEEVAATETATEEMSPVTVNSNQFECSPSQPDQLSESAVAVPVATHIHSVQAEPVHEHDQSSSTSVEAVPIPSTFSAEDSVPTSSSNPFGEDEDEEGDAVSEERRPAASPPTAAQRSSPSPLLASQAAMAQAAAPVPRSTSSRSVGSPAPSPARMAGNPFEDRGQRTPTLASPAGQPSNPFAPAPSSHPVGPRNPFGDEHIHRPPAASAPPAPPGNPFAEEPPGPTPKATAAGGSSILQELKARKAATATGAGSGGGLDVAAPAPPPRTKAADEEDPKRPQKKQLSDALREMQAGLPSAAARPHPPPPPASSAAGRVGPATAKPPRRSMAEAISQATHDQVAFLTPLSNECKLLMQWGVRSGPAEALLSSHDYQLDKALQALNNQICEELAADPTASMMALWRPRLAIKIKSWLPNLMEVDGNDYHTGYVTTVAYTSLRGEGVKSWQLTLRYNRFKAIYVVVSRHQHRTSLASKFPSSHLGQWFTGISDAVRYQRMDGFDQWLREVTLNPVLMTIREVVEAVYSTLMVHENIGEDF